MFRYMGNYKFNLLTNAYQRSICYNSGYPDLYKSKVKTPSLFIWRNHAFTVNYVCTSYFKSSGSLQRSVLSYENIQEQVCLVCASVLRARHAGIVFISFDLPVSTSWTCSTVQVEYSMALLWLFWRTRALLAKFQLPIQPNKFIDRLLHALNHVWKWNMPLDKETEVKV